MHGALTDKQPAPPSSLTSILDSFRRSGEGDRDLLLSILGAKKAEEEVRRHPISSGTLGQNPFSRVVAFILTWQRLTALIQTRLTVLQARLSIHSAAAQLSFSPPTPSVDGSTRDLPLVAERTPSLGGSSRASASSSTGPVSPTYMAPPPVPAQLASEKARGGYFTLPPPQSMLRSRSGSRSPPLGHRDVYPQMRIGERELRMPAPRSGSTSPKSTGSEGRAPGLDMLLDAGMERERRDSTEKR